MRYILYLLFFLSSIDIFSQCIPKCNLNVGYYSDDNPATLGYDNMGSSFHSTFANQTTGYIIWGENMSNAGNTHNLSPIDLNSINYPNLTGDVRLVGVGSSFTPNVQLIVLASTGLFALGNPGAVLSTSIKSTNVFSSFSVNGKADGLPAGLTPDSIKMMFVTTRSIYLTTCSGFVYVLSQDSNVRGGIVNSTTSAMKWSQVMESPGVPLSNVIVTRGQSRFALALKSDSTVWAWGDSILLGNGTYASNYNYAVQIVKPAGLGGIKMIQATCHANGAGQNFRPSYYLLGKDKKVYSLGGNNSGQLGDRTSVSRYVWVNAQNPNGTVIDSAVWISSNEHDLSFSGFSVLKSNGQMYTGGNNASQMIARATTGINFLDTPKRIKTTDTILFCEVGGHTTAFIKLGVSRYGYCGHRTNGSLGDGTTSNNTLDSVNFGITPIINVCGTTCDTPQIEFRPYKCTDTQTVFVIHSRKGNTVFYTYNTGSSDQVTIGDGDTVEVTYIYPPLDLSVTINKVTSNLCNLTLGNITASLVTTSTVDTSVTICSNQKYNLGGNLLDTSGIYLDTLTNTRACDSFITLRLTVIPASYDTIDTAICQGQSFVFNNISRTATGQYYDTLVAANGCDSLITLNLLVRKKDTTYLFDSICLGRQFFFNNNAISTSGIYWDTLVNRYGCDSFIKLDFHFFQTIKSYITDSFCKTGTYNFNGKTLLDSGQYKDTIAAGSGCDSIVFLHLIHFQTIEKHVYDSICTAGSIFFNGNTENTAGIYLDTLVSVSGCDSFVFYHLAIYNKKDTTIRWDSFCLGDKFFFNGDSISMPGIYWDTLSNRKGCDSFIKLNLAYFKPDTFFINTYFCEGNTFLFNGKQLSTVGIYWDTLTNRYGCDSLVKLNLGFRKKDTTSISTYFCEGTTYPFNSMNLDTPGFYIDTLFNRFGCDSFIFLYLSKEKRDTSYRYDTICYNYELIINSVSYKKSGKYILNTYQNIKGCDSFRMLQLIVDTLVFDTFHYSGCKLYNFRSKNYFKSTKVFDTIRHIDFCDSLITVHMIHVDTVIQMPDSNIVFCDSTSLFGLSYYQDTLIKDTIYSLSKSCDSVYRTYNLIGKYHIPISITASPQKDTVRKGDLVNLESIQSPNYLWSTTETNQKISAVVTSDTLFYLITWKDIECPDTAYYKITTTSEALANVPTAFTPNGDGNNDVMYCRSFGIKKLISFKIYSRLGQLLFVSSDLNIGWDGNYNGQPQNSDTYFYTVEVETYEPIRKVKLEGNFMLLR